MKKISAIAAHPMTYILAFAVGGASSVVAGVAVIAGAGLALVTAGALLIAAAGYIARGMQ